MTAFSPRRFRPALWPTLLVIPMLAVLIGLGTWQLERLFWKTALLDHIERQLAAPAVPMPERFDDPAAWDYRRVRVTGTFLNDRELHLLNRTHDGRVGAHVVTPLRRSDAAAPGPAPGPVVLVDRGWVPADRLDPATRPDSLPTGPMTVHGVLRVPPGRGWMQPDNEPARNQWFWLDLPAMAAAAGLSEAPPVILEAGPNPPGAPALPIGGQTRVNIPNDHLQYAITWYGLAAALLVIYGVYAWRERG